MAQTAVQKSLSFWTTPSLSARLPYLLIWVMHAMLRSGQLLDRTAGVAASAALGEGVRLRTLTGRPCRDVGRIIPLDGVHR